MVDFAGAIFLGFRVCFIVERRGRRRDGTGVKVLDREGTGIRRVPVFYVAWWAGRLDFLDRNEWTAEDIVDC